MTELLILPAVFQNIGIGMFWRLLISTVVMLAFGTSVWSYVLYEIFSGEACVFRKKNEAEEIEPVEDKREDFVRHHALQCQYELVRLSARHPLIRPAARRGLRHQHRLSLPCGLATG